MPYSVLSSMTVSGAFADALALARAQDQTSSQHKPVASERNRKTLHRGAWRRWAETIRPSRFKSGETCGQAPR